VIGLGRRAFNEGLGGDLAKDSEAAAGKVADAAGGLLDPKPDASPPKQIQALRDSFEDIL
jgi:hypothetical protein